MSIIVAYYRLPTAEREDVTRSQSGWEQFRQGIQNAYFQSFHTAIAAMKEVNGSREEKLARMNEVLQKNRDPRRFDMEKDWHTIGYLLTGNSQMVEEHQEDDLLYSTIFGGHKTSATTGYGAVRYYDADLVTRSAHALRGIDRELVSRRFDPARMAELQIYAAPQESERDGVLHILEEFCGFFEAAASAREDVIKFAT